MKKFDFTFNDHTISFEFLSDDNIWVNATEMAKIYCKQVNEFLSNKETKILIKALKNKITCTDNSSINGNSRLLEDYNTTKLYFSKKNFGTYMHRKLAIEFAGWLDVEFKLWMNDVIEKILLREFEKLKGITGIQQQLKKVRDDIRNTELKLHHLEDYRTVKQLRAKERKLEKLLKQLPENGPTLFDNL